LHSLDVWNRDTGSIYLHVLVSSLLVSIIGLAALFAVRIQMRSARLTQDYAEARTCAVSAIELGLLHVQDPDWRTTWPNGTWMQDQPLGTAGFTLQGIDPQDGDLADSDYDALILTGIGAKGLARHKTQVVLVPMIEPLEILNTCLHGSGFLQVKGGDQVVVVGAPLSTNGLLDNDGMIDGSAEAGSVADTGTITGSLTVPAPTKRMADAGVISDYASRATSVPFTGDIDKAVLTPGCNPWGPTDPNGLYLINTQGSNLTIKNSRIHGTLVVILAGKTLTLDNALLLHSYRSDFPVLLVEGNVEIKCKSATTPLSETAFDTNFNPLGAPYDGLWDVDKLDQYPTEIRGLIDVDGSLKLRETARIVGVVICDGPVICEGLNTIIHDPSFYACPPEGYTCVSKMQISPESWKQVVD
jgi:hypothetical protein